MKTPLPYLENALDSGHRLLGFLPPSYDEFMDSDLIQSAVCMSFVKTWQLFVGNFPNSTKCIMRLNGNI